MIIVSSFSNVTIYFLQVLCCASICVMLMTDVLNALSMKENINSKSKNTTRNILPEKWIHRTSDNVLFPILDNMELSTSRHVAFTENKPILPPSSDFRNSFTVGLNKINSFSKVQTGKKRRNRKNKKRKNRKNNKRRNRHRHAKSRLRSKRSHIVGEVSSVCTSISKWVTPSGEETLDQWEQPVTILPYIIVGERRIQQFIYETSCLEDNIPCKGIDKRHYKSECITKKVYAYAYVRNSTGEENWSYIQINGYCNCKLQRKHHSGPRNILDYLSLS